MNNTIKKSQKRFPSNNGLLFEITFYWKDSDLWFALIVFPPPPLFTLHYEKRV